MNENKKQTPKKRIRPSAVNCETCEYYDYDEDWGDYVCLMDLDEDEMIRFLNGSNRTCPYYKYYDEYKFVRKQN